MNRVRQAGFTLIELLIALAIFAIVGLVVNDLLRMGAITGAAANARSATLQDAQMAQQIIAGRLSEAVYVYPNMSASSTAFVLSGSGITTKNTVGQSVSGASQQWRVNYDPFVAMILPPRVPGGTCTSKTADETTTTNTTGCYRFFAYYAVSRNILAQATDTVLAKSQKPSLDTNNADKWAIMEYRANLYDTSAYSPTYDSAGTGAITNINFPFASGTGSQYNGQSGRLLLDYVMPNSVSFNVTLPSAAGQPTGSVEFRFNTSRNAAGTTQTANPSGDPLGATVNPRNWVCSLNPATPGPVC